MLQDTGAAFFLCARQRSKSPAQPWSLVRGGGAVMEGVERVVKVSTNDNVIWPPPAAASITGPPAAAACRPTRVVPGVARSAAPHPSSRQLLRCEGLRLRLRLRPSLPLKLSSHPVPALLPPTPPSAACAPETPPYRALPPLSLVAPIHCRPPATVAPAQRPSPLLAHHHRPPSADLLGSITLPAAPNPASAPQAHP